MSAPLINFDEILAPISPDEPAGEDVRYSAITHEIEEARRADDASLPQGDWVAERKAANWPKVRDLAWTTLTTKSKDLQLACCLAEALAHLHGIAGIEAGLSLTNRLLGSFWQTLHPSLAEDGLDERGGRIEWLSSSLAAAMRATLITVRIEGSAYGLLDWKQSRYLENLRLENPTAAQQAIDEGQVPKELFDAKVAATPNQFYLELRELFEPCHTACDDLDKTIRDLFGDEAPSLSELRLAMEDCDTALKGIFKQKRIGVPAETTADDKNADRPARPASPRIRWNSGRLVVSRRCPAPAAGSSRVFQANRASQPCFISGSTCRQVGKYASRPVASGRHQRRGDPCPGQRITWPGDLGQGLGKQ